MRAENLPVEVDFLRRAANRRANFGEQGEGGNGESGEEFNAERYRSPTVRIVLVRRDAIFYLFIYFLFIFWKRVGAGTRRTRLFAEEAANYLSGDNDSTISPRSETSKPETISRK